MDCVCNFPPWRRAFRDRDYLLECRSLFHYMTEAFYLIYQTPFNHAYGSTSRSEISQRPFYKIRRLLSMHTNLGSARQPELIQDIRDTLSHLYSRFLQDIWARGCTGDHWRLNDRNSFKLPPQDQFVNWWQSSFVKKALSPGAEVAYEDLKCFTTVHWQANAGPWQSFPFDWDDMSPIKAKWLFRCFMVLESFCRSLLSQEFQQTSELLEKNPTMLKQHRDPEHHARPNQSHILSRLAYDEKVAQLLPAAKKHASKGNSRFNGLHLPILPFTKHLWFFLECRARMEGLQDEKKVELEVPNATKNDISVVLNNLDYLQPTDLRKLILNSHLWKEDADLTPMARIDIIESKIDLLAALKPPRHATEALMEEILLGTERRPHLTTTCKNGKRSPNFPHDETEHQWLESFVRCCIYMEKHFPRVLEEIEAEAIDLYPPSLKAKERSIARGSGVEMGLPLRANEGAMRRKKRSQKGVEPADDS